MTYGDMRPDCHMLHVHVRNACRDNILIAVPFIGAAMCFGKWRVSPHTLQKVTRLSAAPP